MRKISFAAYYRILLPFLAGLGYLISALWVCRGVLGEFSTSFLGQGELQGWLWRYWWAKNLLLSALSLKVGLSEFFYVLFSVSHYPEAGNMADLIFLSLPLDLLFGLASAYNLKIILILTLNGLAAYLFLRELAKSDLAAFLGGLLFAFNPYILFEIATGRVRQAVIFSLPLFIHYFLKNYKMPSVANALKAGFFLGLTAVIYWYYGVFLLFFMVLFYLYLLITPERAALNLTRLKSLPAVLLFSLVLALPYAAPYVEVIRWGNKLPEVTFGQAFPTLKQVLSPPGQVGVFPLIRSFRRFLEDSPSGDYLWAKVPRYSFPLLFSLLALIPFYLGGRRLPAYWGLWLLELLFFYLLSLGPYLKWGPESRLVVLAGGLGVRLPYVFFFQYFPLFSRLFSPSRVIAMVSLWLAVLLSLNLKWLFDFFRPKKAFSLLLFLIMIFAFFAGLKARQQAPLPQTRISLPAFYQKLAKEAPCGVIELPLGMGDLGNFYQIYHHKRVLRGWGEYSIPKRFPESEMKWLATVPPELQPRGVSPGEIRKSAYLNPYYSRQNSFLALLEKLDPGKKREEFTSREKVNPQDIKVLKQAGYKYLLLHQIEFLRLDPAGGRNKYLTALEQLSYLLGPPYELEYEENEREQFFEIAVFRL